MIECDTCREQTEDWIRYIDDNGEIVALCLDCYEGLLEFIGTDSEED